MADNPNLISKKAMEAMANTSGSSYPLMSEIFLKVNNAKDKPKKIEILRQYNKPSIRQVLKGCFDPKVEWELPEGTPPYIENDVPAGTEHTLLMSQAQKLWHFVKGADMATSRIQKETMFIQMLEGLHKDEAKVLLDMKNGTLNKTYKGLTAETVKEAFNWNDNFTTK